MNEEAQSTIYRFDSNEYIRSLMEEIGFTSPDLPLYQETSEELEKQMNYVVLSNASLYADDETLDEVITRYGKTNDLSELVRELVRLSPELQSQLLESLKELRDETVVSYERLKTE